MFKYDQADLNATVYSAKVTVTCVGATETKTDTLSGSIAITQEDLSRVSKASIGMGELKGNKSGFSLQFTNTSETVCLGENISYLWDFGDGTTSTELAPAHNYIAMPYGQTFNVSLKVSCGGVEIANNTFPVTINGNEEKYYHIVSNFSNAPSSVTLDTVGITYTDASEIMCMTAEPSYLWRSNAAGISIEPTPTFTYNFRYAEGKDFTDIVSLTVTCGQVKNTIIKNVSATLKEIRPLVPPTKIIADWEYSKPEINKDTFLVKFTNKSTTSCNEFTPHYNWTFGDGAVSDEANPTHSYVYNPGSVTESTPITKNVSLEVTCAGQLPEDPASLSTKADNVHLTSADLAKASIADFTVKDITGNKTSFTAIFENKSITVCTSSNTSYLWDFGDGSTSTEFEPSHTYTNVTYPANYTVKMNVFCGSSETDTPKTVKVSVSANSSSFFKIKPQWSYNLESIAASTFKINFINSSSVQCLGTEPKYSWNFGNGTFSSDANPTHDFNFTPPLNFSDNISLTIFCGPKTEKLVKEVKATTNEENYSITPSFTYALGAVNDKTVTVNFTNTSSISCPGTVPTYKWVFGDGTESIDQNPIHKYAYNKPLNLSPKALLTVQCDSKSAQKEETLSITPDPLTFQMTADWTYAQTGVDEVGAVISFTNTSTAICPGVEPVYEWDFGPTIGKSNVKHPQQSFTKAQLDASQNISLVLKCAGASDSAPKTMQISGGQFIKTDWSYQMISVDYTAPIQAHVKFSDVSQITCDTSPTYKWNFGDGSAELATSASSVEYTYSVAKLPASYLATLTVVCGKFSLKKEANITLNDVKISGGEFHTFTAINGSTYVWGANDFGQLALSSVNGSSRQTIPTKPAFFTDKTIIATKGGVDYSALLSNDGKVYTFGKGSSGQLGYASAGSANATPVQVTEGGLGSKFVTMISAGGTHMLALTNAGELYVWGSNAKGETMDGGTSNKKIPVLSTATFDGNIKAISAGTSFSVALTDTGSVYTWGGNTANGELGNGTTAANVTTPTKVAALSGKKIVAISAYTSNTIALTDDGNVYTWGANNFGQLGNGTVGASTGTPQHITFPAGVNIIAVDTGSSHMMALSSSGVLYAWGLNTSGQLGINSAVNSSSPVAVTAGFGKGEKVVSMVAKGAWSIALTDAGKMYSWGVNKWAQLGLGDTSNRLIPTHITKFPADSGMK